MPIGEGKAKRGQRGRVADPRTINSGATLTDDGCGTTCESACPAQSGC